jgi:hypothetical protein
MNIAALAHVKTEIELVNRAVANLQKTFCEVIKDKTIPLDERWNLWRDAPSNLKENESWIVNFEIENKVGEISWFDDFYIERNQTIYMADIIEREREDVKYLQGDPDYKFAKQITKKFMDSPELLDEWREEILQLNLESFQLYW